MISGNSKSLLNLVRFITLRRLQKHKARTFITIFGIVISVALFVGVRAMQTTVTDSIRRVFDSMSGKAQIQVVGIDETGFDEKLLEIVQAAPCVDVAVPVVICNTVAEGSTSEVLTVMGVDTLDDRMMRDYKLSGEETEIEDPLMFITQVNSILLTRQFAEKHNIVVDQTVRLYTDTGYKDFVVRGLLAPFGVAKVMGGSLVVMDVYSSQMMFGKTGKFDTIDITLKPGYTLDQAIQSLRALVGDKAKVERPIEKSARIERMLRSLDVMFNIVSITALFIASFLIFNTVSISVVQRLREIGVLRAIGCNRRSIMLLFIMEAMLMGLLGGSAGVALGYVLARGMVRMVGAFFANLSLTLPLREVSLPLWLALAGAGVGMVVSALAAYYPSHQASRVDPLEVIRMSAYESRRVLHIRRNSLVGLALVVLGFLLLALPMVWGLPLFGYLSSFVVLLGISFLIPFLVRRTIGLFDRALTRSFGVLGRISVGNISRAISRNSVTVSAIMIGLTFVVIMAVFIASYRRALLSWSDNAFTAEIIVSPPTKMPSPTSIKFGAQIMDEIRPLPGVEDVVGVRIVNFFRYDNKTIIVRALDMERFISHRSYFDPHERFLQGDRKLAVQECLAGRAIWVSDAFVEKQGADLGDTVQLETPAGVTAFQIAGVVRDYISDEGVVFFDRPTFSRLWNDDLLDMVQVFLEPGTDVGRVKEAILKAVPENQPVMVLTNTEFKQDLRDILDQSFYLTYAMNAVAILVAILAIVNTLIASIMDRYREIGVMRAVGASRRQIRQIIVIEAVVLGIYGAVLGLVVGTVLEWVGINTVSVQATGWQFGTVIPVLFMVIAFTLTILVSVVSGFATSRRATNANIVEAIQYE